ncbi:phosphopentomutase [Culicoidibacter larvae]|uniref:Phosphopentomutase n=1 Tax=Culicoidibacter larvae TaxID=2579976 RepID=A0A5R8QAS0_9FIRM|nr:phosphopentomutase [Culicoidibacter larvae]TLG72993.1 phosphopentomutase [Culicoidibacter larvae]
MGRFIVIVLDSFGVGAMDDVVTVRPQDQGANTAKHLLATNGDFYWPTLERLGLMEAVGAPVGKMQLHADANFGTSNLKHFGADTFYGHQEIMGTDPKKPEFMKLNARIEAIAVALEEAGHTTRLFMKDGLHVIVVDEAVIVADNMETDLGQVINVSGSLDLLTFDEIVAIGRVVREQVTVSRVIALGGREVSLQNMLDAVKTKDGFIGLDTPASGLYKHDYHVIHLGYGVDSSVQVPTLLHQAGVPVVLLGKVADIVANPSGALYPGVESEYLFDELFKQVEATPNGFICLNIQETDLAGHAEDPVWYGDRITLSDKKIGELTAMLNDEDILIVMADHGNDPTIGHSKHTRERVPLMIYKKGIHGVRIGNRETMADVGATATDYFGIKTPFGTSFLELLK